MLLLPKNRCQTKTTPASAEQQANKKQKKNSPAQAIRNLETQGILHQGQPSRVAIPPAININQENQEQLQNINSQHNSQPVANSQHINLQPEAALSIPLAQHDPQLDNSQHVLQHSNNPENNPQNYGYIVEEQMSGHIDNNQENIPDNNQHNPNGNNPNGNDPDDPGQDPSDPDLSSDYDDDMDEEPQEENPTDLAQPSHQQHIDYQALQILPPAATTNLQYASLVKKPNPFTGDRKHVNIMLWLKKLELFLTCNNVPKVEYLRVAICFLDGPALDLFLAHKHERENRKVWTNTYEEFASILLKAYGHIDEDFSMRTKITKLQLKDNNILGYTKLFHTLVHKLQKNIPTDIDKITWYFSGIQDKTLYADLIINPATGLRWETWDTLYYFVMSKYSFLQNHFPHNNPSINRIAKSTTKFRPFNRRPYQTDFKRSFNFKPNRTSWNSKQYNRKPYSNRPFRFQRNNNGPKFQNRFGRNNNNPNRRNFNSRPRFNQPRDSSRNRYDMQTLDISKLTPGQPLSAAQRQYLASAKLCYKCFKSGHLGSHCPNSRNNQ